MALVPLKIQQPTVSLISGKELPKASGEGVRAPDISDAFSRLSNTLYRKDAENRQIDDQLQAQTDFEAYRTEWTGKHPGENPFGMYERLPEVNGTPAYRAAVMSTMESNTRSDLQQLAATDFAAIWSRTDIDTGKKISLISAKAEGYIAGLHPQFREDARKWLAAETTQWSNSLVSADYQKEQAALVDGAEHRIKVAGTAAVSAGAAGADYTPYTQEAYRAIDDLVRLGRMTPEDAQIYKDQFGRTVLAATTQRQIVNGALNANVTPQNLADYALALATGGTATLEMTVPGRQETVNAAGQLIERKPADTKKLMTTDQHRLLLQDPALVNQTAQDLGQLATNLMSDFNAHQKERQFWNFVTKVADGVTPLTPALKEYWNNKAAELIEDDAEGKNAFTDPAKAKLLTELIYRTLVMPKPVTDKLMNMSNGTIEEAKIALSLFNQIAGARTGERETGQMITDTMELGDKHALIAKRDALTRIVRSGATAEASEQAWREFTNKLRDPANNVGFFKQQYHDEVDGSPKDFDADVQRAFMGHYSTVQTMPPRFASEVADAYLVEMTMSDGSQTPSQVFEKVMNSAFERFQASPVFKNGVVMASDLTNPPGWEGDELARQMTQPPSKPWKWGDPIDFPYQWNDTKSPLGAGPVSPYAWLNTYTVEQLHHALADGQVANDQTTVDRLNEVLAAGVDGYMPLGKGVFLNPTYTDMDNVQFEVWVAGDDGTQTKLMVRNAAGRAQPMLLDPGLVRSAIVARKQLAEDTKKGQFAHAAAMDKQLLRQGYPAKAELGWMTGVNVTAGAVDVDSAAFKNWFMKQPPDWRKDFTKSQDDYYKQLENQMQQMLKLEETKFPGFTVSPETLMLDNAGGVGVTTGAIDAVEQLWPDGLGGQGMMNFALAESNGGRNLKHVNPEDVGILGINVSANGALNEVIRRSKVPGDPMQKWAADARRVFGVDVASLTPLDMRKPLANAIVSRMYVMRSGRAIPADPQAQAEYWREYYNPNATDSMLKHFVASAGSVLISEARASGATATRSLEPGSPGMITDMAGNAFPANFTATLPMTQTSAQRLSAAFGQPLRITPHGGTQPDARRSTSQHHHKTAIDIYVADMSDADKTRLISLAIQMGYRGIGGYGAGDGKGTIHLDLRGYGHSGGLAKWWRHRAGVDGKWHTGEKWFVDGIKRGASAKGIPLG